MVRLRLRFPADLEPEFRAQYMRTFVQPMRVFWIIALLLWVSGAFSDRALFPEVAGRFVVIRVGVGLCIASVVAVLFSPGRSAPYVRRFAAIVVTLGGLGYVTMLSIVPLPAGFSIFTLVLCVTAVASAFVSILRFDYALLACLAIVAAFELSAFVLVPIDPALAVRTTLTLVGLSAVGLFSCYATERYARENFLQRRELQHQAEALAEKMRELALSEQRAQEASRAKSAFLSNMSHELRTPLNAVLGFAQLLERDRSLGADGHEKVATIQRAGEHLLGLINDVLSISKIEAGKLSLTERPFDLIRLVRDVEEMVRVRTVAKGLDLRVDVDAEVPTAVHGDEGKVRQILVNLLGNAVKFTETGGVTVRAGWRDSRATLEVTDTGYGIAEHELDALFDAFGQTESGRRSSEGTGLGLALSRSFARAMGGDIAVRSEIGLGSTFTVELPLPTAEPLVSEIAPSRVVGLAPGSATPRVLVVDDTRDNCVLLRQLLSPIGFEVREASNGAEAIEIWQDWRPDAILMDMRMPVMSGVEATAEIRRRESAQCSVLSAESSDPSSTQHSALSTQHCSIIAFTASAFEHERERILARGCDAFVTKPFKESTVFSALAEQLGLEYVYAEPAEASPETEPAITTARLTLAPAEWRESFEQALVDGDVQELLKAADALAPHDERLAAELRKAVREYRFDELLDRIKAV